MPETTSEDYLRSIIISIGQLQSLLWDDANPPGWVREALRKVDNDLDDLVLAIEYERDEARDHV